MTNAGATFGFVEAFFLFSFPTVTSLLATIFATSSFCRSSTQRDSFFPFFLRVQVLVWFVFHCVRAFGLKEKKILLFWLLVLNARNIFYAVRGFRRQKWNNDPNRFACRNLDDRRTCQRSQPAKRRRKIVLHHLYGFGMRWTLRNWLQELQPYGAGYVISHIKSFHWTMVHG